MIHPGELLPHLRPKAPDARLLKVAKAFADLQYARHSADYDLSGNVDIAYAAQLIFTADGAVGFLAIIGPDPDTVLFLTALLLADRWARRG